MIKRPPASLLVLSAAAVGTLIWAASCAVAPTPGAAPSSMSSNGGGSGGGGGALPDDCDAGGCVDPCQVPGPGCPCFHDGELALCGHVESQVGNQPVCGLGYSTCTDGVYSDCVINNTITLGAPQAPAPAPGAVHATSLAAPTTCAANPCDPSCNDFPDTPTGLGSLDAGLAASDAGLTLIGYDAGGVALACTGGTTQSCSHSLCSTGVNLAVGCDNAPAPATPFGCVAKVCAASPSCCSSAWSAACVASVPGLCNVDCGSINGACAVCYKDTTDHDGDGYAWTQGDCADCDPNINPGAYDYPGNGVDEDCSGAADDQPVTCDGSLALASGQAADFASAMDLCKTTTAAATGVNKTWGVLSSRLVQADGSQAPSSLGYGILTKYGPNNLPQLGAAMAVFSTGTARAVGDPGWVNPNGQFGSYNQGKTGAYPTGFPKNKAGCANGTGSAFDSTGLLMSIRVPTNARSFSYRFNFFSSEYPEYVCTAFNDGYVALLQTGYLPANPATNSGNISFDSQNSPVSVNVGFFTVTSGAKLTGTGLDGLCGGQICGGATDWLQTSAPVVPGETIKIQFSIWDTGDHAWDSSVLVDGWTWSASPASIVTKKPAVVVPPTYSDGYFVRDYDASKICPVGTAPVWGLWSWNSVTPSTSSISFSAQLAASSAGLASAPVDALVFSEPPGPAALAGQAAVAKAGSPSTNAGSVIVDTTLLLKGRIHNLPYLRITSHLTPSSDKLSAPVLSAWDLQVSCLPSE
jgi:hypothetical protein